MITKFGREGGGGGAYVFFVHAPWPVDGIEEESLEVADPRDKMGCARDSAAVTARMGVYLRLHQ